MVNKKVSVNFKLKVDIWRKRCFFLNTQFYSWFPGETLRYPGLTFVFLEKINSLMEYYNLLLSEICIFRKQFVLPTSTITKGNLPSIISRMQCLFIESPVVLLYTIFSMNSLGFGIKSFFDSKFLRQFLEEKKFKGFLLQVSESSRLFNDGLVFSIFKKIRVILFQKNYKADSIKKI